MTTTKTDILVYSDWHSNAIPQLMGILTVQQVRRKEVFSFEFDTTWLKANPTQMLDPDLTLYGGPQYSIKANFNLFLDSAPDRWGRQLMRRREAIKARRESRSIHNLQESDYLLGVFDETRMGAIRFKLSPDGDFINNERDMATPPWASLRELEAASREYEEDQDNENTRWLSLLLAPGSSLGGARPKANVLDTENNLWIAKFPSKSDSVDIGAWEMVVHQLAREAELNVPECRIKSFSKHGSTFICKRFDRSGLKRIHFSSAMTLLGKNDGADYQDGSSYLDIAQFIIRYGANPNKDLNELWRRIVFSIAIKNTDDHLRNHGFMLTQSGWRLSPAYDLNPNPSGTGLSLNINENDNSLDYDLTREVAPFFRLSTVQADSEIKTIRRIVSQWQPIAASCGLSRNEQQLMQPAF